MRSQANVNKILSLLTAAPGGGLLRFVGNLRNTNNPDASSRWFREELMPLVSKQHRDILGGSPFEQSINKFVSLVATEGAPQIKSIGGSPLITREGGGIPRINRNVATHVVFAFQVTTEDPATGKQEKFVYTTDSVELQPNMRLDGAEFHQVLMGLMGNRRAPGSTGAGYDSVVKIKILNMREITSVRAREFRDGTHRQQLTSSLRAFHRFGTSGTIAHKFAIAPLRLPHIPCIFEALMIIRVHQEGKRGDSPLSTAYRDIQQWELLLNRQWFTESLQMQLNLMEGRLMEVVESFNEQQRQCNSGLEVYIFNRHNWYQDRQHFSPVLSSRSGYFILYEREHVYPYTASGITQLTTMLQQKRQMKEQRAKYSIKPEDTFWEDKFNTLEGGHDNTRLFKIAPLQAKVRTIFLDALSKYSKVEVLSEEIGKLCKRWKGDNIELKLTLSELMDDLQERIQNRLGDVEMTRQTLSGVKRGVIMGELLGTSGDGMMEDDIQQELNQHIQEEVKKKERIREEKFEQMGICGLDIETYVDNDNWMNAQGNFKPYVLSIHGKLVRVEEVVVKKTDRRKKEKVVNGKRQVRVVDDVSQDFVGEDCVAQFVGFLIERRYISMIGNKRERSLGEKQNRDKRFLNMFVAHNGCRFDFKFLYEALYAMIGDFSMVGSIQQTKAVIGQGLLFIDTSLIIPGSLENIAKTFFPADQSKQKFKNETIKGLTREEYVGLTAEVLQEICVYCQQDAKVVYWIGYTFFKQIYTQSINRRFIDKPYCYSSAQLAWAIWERCFLRVIINTNPNTLEAERQSYRGGFTCAYKVQSAYGIAIDINSSYPAAMMNLMPAFHIMSNSGPEQFTHPRQMELSELVPYFLYHAIFQFPTEELYPTIGIRVNHSIVNVQRIEESEDYQWLWGVELIQAIQCGGKVKVKGCVRYEPSKTHNRFIDYMYKQRLQAKREKNAVMDVFSKLCMNSEYGKHGQRDFGESMIGGRMFMVDMMYQLQEEEQFGTIQDVQAVQYPTDTYDMFQIKFNRPGQALQQKGASVRFASYITAVARVNLQRAIHSVSKTIGKHRIAYVDTDSIYIDLVPFVQRHKVIKDILDIQSADGIIRQLKGMNKSLNEMLEIQCEDIRMIGDKNQQRCRLIDETLLGAFKIERVYKDGMFLGAKQYSVKQKEGEQKQWISQLKLKGVPSRDRAQEIFAQLWEEMQSHTKLEQEVIPERVMKQTGLRTKLSFMSQHGAKEVKVNNVFRNMGTGVHLSSMLKVICPTLHKRLHVVSVGIIEQQKMGEDYSVPFETANDYLEGIKESIRVHKLCKRQLMQEKEFLFTQHQSDPAVSSLRLQNQQRSMLQLSLENQTDKLDMLVDGRLEKIRAAHTLRSQRRILSTIPDEIAGVMFEYRLEYSNWEVFKFEVQSFISRKYIQIEQGIKLERAAKKRPINLSDNEWKTVDISLMAAQFMWIYTLFKKSSVVLPLGVVKTAKVWSKVLQMKHYTKRMISNALSVTAALLGLTMAKDDLPYDKWPIDEFHSSKGGYSLHQLLNHFSLLISPEHAPLENKDFFLKRQALISQVRQQRKSRQARVAVNEDVEYYEEENGEEERLEDAAAVTLSPIEQWTGQSLLGFIVRLWFCFSELCAKEDEQMRELIHSSMSVVRMRMHNQGKVIDLDNSEQVPPEIRSRYIKEFYDTLTGMQDVQPNSVLAHKRKLLTLLSDWLFKCAPGMDIISTVGQIIMQITLTLERGSKKDTPNRKRVGWLDIVRVQTFVNKKRRGGQKSKWEMDVEAGVKMMNEYMIPILDDLSSLLCPEEMMQITAFKGYRGIENSIEQFSEVDDIGVYYQKKRERKEQAEGLEEEDEEDEGEDFANPFIEGEALEDDSPMEEEEEEYKENEDLFIHTPEYFLRESNDQGDERLEHSWEMFDQIYGDYGDDHNPFERDLFRR